MEKYAVSLFLIFLILFEYKMERDKIKNIRYFEEYINKKDESNCRIKSWFINGEINPDRREIMLEKMFQNNIYSLIAKYSAGYPIEELYTDYYDALEYMHQSWMVLDNRAYLKDTKYNHYFGSDYDLMLWMLSLGYLLDVEKQKYILLLEILDRFSVKDLLYETIIKAKISERPPITEESYKMIMDMPWAYESLRHAIKETDDEYGKERSSALIEHFLNKEFYQRHKGFSFYDHHKSDNNIYYGYWSFESAAIADILSVDISPFENNKYFPKDMFFYKKNRVGGERRF